MNDVQPVTWLVIAAVLAVAGLAVGWSIGRGGQKGPVPRAATSQAVSVIDDRAAVRASALDSLAEAVLITDDNARVRDCNASALTLFNRHRGEVEEQFATSLRRFDGLDQSEPYKLAREHAVWVGEGWARQPDGGMKLCQVRVMAIRDARARVVAFAESFRDVAHDRNIEQDVRDWLYGVRTFEPSGSPSERLSSVRDELRVLSEGFRDLDHVLKQYERLLPSLGADDPLAESIAGAAHDARAAVAAVGVPALLEEIPRALARLRANLQSLPPDVMPADAPASEGTSRE
ncbi:MAG TPA: PAS domain-containing protein [Gemmatimonadaceae bacterium]|nr:PAS domain-containing protein [Gemmatimonadaceae bacterium]